MWNKSVCPIVLPADLDYPWEFMVGSINVSCLIKTMLYLLPKCTRYKTTP